MSTTRVVQRTKASRAAVYRACLDPRDVARWMVPDGMTSEVHELDAREGGVFRISLTYESPENEGKSSENTDTFHGHFERLVPDEQIVQVIEFETDKPEMQGEMRATITLRDLPGGDTEIEYLHEGVPDAVKPEDNEDGTRMALAKLAAIAEGRAI
jgi:uncharacterized protein YndB with AHSA1/START domain